MFFFSNGISAKIPSSVLAGGAAFDSTKFQIFTHKTIPSQSAVYYLSYLGGYAVNSLSISWVQLDPQTQIYK